VLLLDAQDYYGGAWASLNGPAFARLLFGGRGGGGGGAEQPAAAAAASSSSSMPLPRHALPPLRASGVTTWGSRAGDPATSGAAAETPAESAAASPPPASLLPPLLARCRALDLLPRALYQGEPLVDGLVAARAHPYVEFKLVEGSYVLDADAEGASSAAAAAAADRRRPGRGVLLRIPASKAHIFADRGLAPREKQALMRFLAAGLEAAAAVAAAAAEAAEGSGGRGAGGAAATPAAAASAAAAAAAAAQGAFPAAAARSKEASSLVAALARRDVPLARVMRREGVPRRVRDFVLYGIAMACVPEEEEEEGEEEEEAGQGVGGAAGAAPAAAGAAAAAAGAAAAPGIIEATTSTDRLSAADGRDALALYASSLGRFDAPAPPPEQRRQLGGASSSSAAAAAAAVVAPPPPPPASAFMAATHGSGSLVEAFVRHAAVRGALTVLRRPVEALLLSEDGRAIAGVRLRAGARQELASGAVVGARAALASDGGPRVEGGRRARRLARCVALLDGPLRPEGDGGASSAPDSFALLVAPPAASSAAASSAAASSAAAAVVTRGLLLGPSAQAGPPAPAGARPLFLLYLVADVSHLDGAASAEDVLAPALTRLAARGAAAEESGRAAERGAAAGRPRVLAAAFYSQEGEAAAGPGGDDDEPALPGGLVACPGPEEVAPGVAGYVGAWAAAERLYRRHFPGLPWLGEQPPPPAGVGGKAEDEKAAAAAAEEEGDGGGGGGGGPSSDPPTEGLDAIDELSSALAALEREDAG
jgi:hypothetical protein